MMYNKKYIFILLPVLVSFLIGEVGAQAYFSNKKGVVLDGYDVVAYHQEGEAILENNAHEVEWDDFIWYFSSEENAALFADDPESYAPQYGGYCAYAVANNALVPVDPEAFSIVDEKLYLNFSEGVQRRWRK